MKINTLLKRTVYVIVIAMVFLLSACGSKPLKEAQKAFDAGEYEQVIQIITESGESLSENEELNTLYISSYEKWCEELIAAGEYEKAITNLNDSGISLDNGLNITNVYIKAWQKLADQKIEEKDYFQAFDLITKMVGSGMISDAEAKENYYKIGDGFFESKSFAQAGIAFAKADDYNDASEKCKSSWDKGAFRNTACIEDYTAIGIKDDGTVVSAVNSELIDTVQNVSARHAREKTTIKTDGWKDIVSVKCNETYYIGLVNDGSIKIGETGFKDMMTDGNLRSVDWKDIVAIDLEYGTLAGLDKYGKVHIAGDDQADFSAANSWEDIVQISLDYCVLTGVDIFGNVHVINTRSNRDDFDSTDPSDCPFEEAELQSKSIKQFITNSYYGVYVTDSGELHTTATAARAERTEFMQPIGGDVQMELEDYSGFDNSDFVSCDASYDYYMGLRKDGTVRVGGHMGSIFENNLGVKKLSGLQEAHLGIGSNPVVYGVTKDGSFKMMGYEGGQYIPYHDRIRSWGKLKAPTIEY